MFSLCRRLRRFLSGEEVVRSGANLWQLLRLDIESSLPLLNMTKGFYEYCANHTIKLSPPSDLVGRWTTTVGGAVDRLGGNASPPKWKQSYNIQSALNGGLGWYILLAGWLDVAATDAECRRL
jgi:hypothetical protein